MKLLGVAQVLFVIAIVGTAVACGEPDWAGGNLEGGGDAKATPKSTDGGDEECLEEAAPSSASSTSTSSPASSSAGIDVDIASLSACCEDKGGKAHCVPSEKISSASTRSSLAACDSGGLCVPDSLIEGKVPKACETGFTGQSAEGVCMSTCVKAVADKASLLKQQTCGQNEVCTPCISPLDGKATGVCDLGKKSSSSSSSSSGAAPAKKCKKKSDSAAESEENKKKSDADGGAGTTTPKGPATCCGDQGLCVPESVVPEDKRDHLEAKECTSGNLCAPKTLADKNAKPKTCKGDVITGDYEGVCLSNCLVFGFLESLISEQGSCGPDERCLPCKTPFGTATGAPGCE